MSLRSLWAWNSQSGWQAEIGGTAAWDRDCGHAEFGCFDPQDSQVGEYEFFSVSSPQHFKYGLELSKLSISVMSSVCTFDTSPVGRRGGLSVCLLLLLLGDRDLQGSPFFLVPDM